MATDGSSLLHAPRCLQKHAVALDIPRLLAAVHIIFYHTQPHSSCFTWGVTQVPFFFALTGFGVTHSYLLRKPFPHSRFDVKKWKDILPKPQTLLRRIGSLYPTYIIALGAVLALGPTDFFKKVYPEFHPFAFVLELLMLQAWLPSRVVGSAYNVPAWYVSVLVFFWLLEKAYVLASVSLCRRAGMGRVPWAGVLAVCLWVWAWPFALLPWPWRALGVTEIPVLQYLHMPLCGALTAGWLHGRAAAGRPPLRYVATCSAALLVTLYCTAPAWLGSDKLVSDVSTYIDQLGHNIGVLLPLQCALIAGACARTRALRHCHHHQLRYRYRIPPPTTGAKRTRPKTYPGDRLRLEPQRESAQPA